MNLRDIYNKIANRKKIEKPDPLNLPPGVKAFNPPATDDSKIIWFEDPLQVWPNTDPDAMQGTISGKLVPDFFSERKIIDKNMESVIKILTTIAKLNTDNITDKDKYLIIEVAQKAKNVVADIVADKMMPVKHKSDLESNPNAWNVMSEEALDRAMENMFKKFQDYNDGAVY